MILSVLIIVVLGLEIGITPRHDTITFVISDGEMENAALCCGRRSPIGTRGMIQLQDSLPVYDLQITVFPVDSQAPSLSTGGPFLSILSVSSVEFPI